MGNKGRGSLICIGSLGALALGVFLLQAPRVSSADTTDFGGYSDRFRGDGDKQPPRCQIDIPRASTTPFFISWNCVDDAASPDEIRTELWMLRKNANAPVKVADFLGFPASVRVDEGLLGAASMSDGLPASFRLLARDRSGVASLSPFLNVSAQDNNLSSCDLQITTEAGEADVGGSTMSVVAQSVPVRVSQRENTDLNLETSAATAATPCEIAALCQSETEGANQIAFAATLTTSGSTISGELSVNSGALVAQLSGTTDIANAALGSFQASGKTTIQGSVADVNLVCRQ